MHVLSSNKAMFGSHPLMDIQGDWGAGISIHTAVQGGHLSKNDTNPEPFFHHSARVNHLRTRTRSVACGVNGNYEISHHSVSE